MMKKSKIAFNVVLSILGIGILGLGLAFIKLGIGVVIPYICVGLGCGLFGQGFGNLISNRIAKKNPAFAKQQEIEKSDERNVLLAGLAGLKAYNAMVYIFGALMVAFALMNVELKVILLLVFAYLFVCGVHIFYRIKYEKEL